jgi:hypothetical protein
MRVSVSYKYGSRSFSGASCATVSIKPKSLLGSGSVSSSSGTFGALARQTEKETQQNDYKDYKDYKDKVNCPVGPL